MDVKEARQILGTTAQNMTDERVLSLLAAFENLADLTLDMYETKSFGKTLKELGVDNEN